MISWLDILSCQLIILSFHNYSYIEFTTEYIEFWTQYTPDIGSIEISVPGAYHCITWQRRCVIVFSQAETLCAKMDARLVDRFVTRGRSDWNLNPVIAEDWPVSKPVSSAPRSAAQFLLRVHFGLCSQADSRPWPLVVKMLYQRRKRWPSIDSALARRHRSQRWYAINKLSLVHWPLSHTNQAPLRSQRRSMSLRRSASTLVLRIHCKQWIYKKSYFREN